MIFLFFKNSDFVDDSESDGSSESDFTNSSSSSESSVEEIRSRGRPPLIKSGRSPIKVHESFGRGPGRPPLDRKPHVFMPSKSALFSPVPIPIKKKIKRDRFYDRSRDIPNEVYFGEINGKFEIFIKQSLLKLLLINL